MSDEKTTKSLQDQKIAAEEAAKSAETLADAYKEAGANAKSLADAADHATRATNANLEALQRKQELAEINLKIIQQGITDGTLQGKQAVEALSAAEAKVKIEKENVGVLQEQINAQARLADEYQRGIDKATDAGAKLANNLFGVSDAWKETWWGNLATGNFTEKLSAMGDGFAQAMKPANVLGSLMMKVQESTFIAAMRFDSATSQLAAATGQGTRYNSMIMEVAENTRQFGVGIQGAASAIQGLNEGMSGFSQVSTEVQTALVKQAAIMERLGVSSQTTGKITDQLTKGMGMSAQQAMDTNNELARAAMGIGVPVAKMAQEFDNAMPVLAKYGREAPKIFKKVMAAAKGLGVEMNTLLGFTSQFDTFEGAATAVGKLNNILGGDLFNSYEMINASEEERIELMLRNLELSGKNFNSMNRFEKMALANAAGIQDMAEANKIFGGGLAAYQQAQREVEANAVSQKELEKRTQAAVSVQEKMNQVIESFAILLEPIVSGLHSFFNALLAVNDATGGMLMPILLGLAGVYFLVANAQSVAAAGAFLQGKAAIFAGFGMKAQAAGQTAVATTAAPASAGLAALAAGMAALGSPPAIFALAAIAGVAVGLGMIAVGVALAISSIVSLVKLFAEMPQLIAPVSLGMLGFLAAMTAVVLGVSMLAPLAPAFLASAASISAGMMTLAPGLIAFSLGLAALGGAMQLIGGGELAAMLGLALVIVPFGIAMLAASSLIALAAPIMTAGLIQLGIGFSFLGVGLTIMTAGIPSMLMLIPLLPAFALSLLTSSAMFGPAATIIGPAATLLGAGFMVLGLGLTIMTLGIPAMLLLSMALPLFSQALAFSAPLFAAGALVVGLTGGILGMGLAQLGLGLLVATLAIPAMFLMALALPLFASGLMLAAPSLLASAMLIGPAAALLGASFAILGIGLAIATFGVPAMFGLALALPLFAMGLLFAAPLMNSAAVAFAPAALLLGIGLGILGLSLLLFDKDTVEIMGRMMIALPMFAVGLLVMSGLIASAAIGFGIPALMLGVALGVFGMALSLFDRKMVKMMMELPLALVVFSVGLLGASFILSAAAGGFLLPALSLALALGAFGLALKLFNKKTLDAMAGITIFLIPFAVSLLGASLTLMLGGPLFALGATAAAVGLIALGVGFRTLPDNFADNMTMITAGIVPFALALAAAGPSMLVGGALFGLGALLLAPGLSALSGPLGEFADSLMKVAPVATQIPQIIASLALMGPALVAFAFSMAAFGLAASLPFFDTGLESFAEALGVLATSFDAMPLEKTVAMGQFFQGLATLSGLENMASVMSDVAMGILGIALALQYLPEEKTFALSHLMTSVTEASVKVTPEGVESVKGLVEQASAYAEVQAEFKAPSVDAFVQALKKVNEGSSAGGASGAESSSGRDIILQLNGRELGRAVDAHLEDKHNLRTN